MNINIDELKIYKKEMVEGERHIISNYELNIDHYSVGTVCNEINDLYEVYIYIIDNNCENIVSSLSLMNLDNKDEAVKTFEEYSELIKKNDLNLITNFVSK